MFTASLIIPIMFPELKYLNIIRMYKTNLDDSSDSGFAKAGRGDLNAAFRQGWKWGGCGFADNGITGRKIRYIVEKWYNLK